MGMGNDPRYNASLTFETFPFPPGFDLARLNRPRIAGRSRTLPLPPPTSTTWREKWLNPDGWLDLGDHPGRTGCRLSPATGPQTGTTLPNWKKRTLTNLYNAMPRSETASGTPRPSAVAAAYGWDDYTPDMPDATLLKRLLSLNLERARH